MKDMLTLMRFDFMLVRSIALPVLVAAVLLLTLGSLLLTPYAACYLVAIVATMFIVPLMGSEDRNGFSKLYGILPVTRQSIPRARFLYIFLLCLTTEAYSVLIAALSHALQLVRYMPGQDSPMIVMARKAFEDPVTTPVGTCVGTFLIIVIAFSYMEMMGQLLGRENEFKVILITLAVLTALTFAFLHLVDLGVIEPRLPELPATLAFRIPLWLGLNLAAGAIVAVFGGITAARVSVREL